ncbi:hypothetical protein C3747_95g109 [Trypanosoma cruzi]|uniref:Flagellar attachment zone protein 1 conserved domain-containing protein n=1 Tax=Trypanosoma cruzi TaxID=5693 RepID=A0A2V2WHL2_TRYCR|nr:hypothetical protein C3747_95g109 [Trypanosoma cruzi]RNC60816.1 hypothetical protein TcCL_ESM01472 [Trypanosoma cruzi]
MAAAKTELAMELNDVVCFERLCADREWRNTLGKVIGFPTSTHVRVELFERAEQTNHSVSIVDEKLQEMATDTGKLAVWEEKLELDHQLQQAVEEEDKASEKLFKLRDTTQQRQSKASARVRETMEALDEARKAMTRVPPRQWRDVRAPGRPTESLVSICRAVMLALQEDRVKSWDGMQAVMRQQNFTERLMHLDCTVTPLPLARRKKIVAELGVFRRELHGGNSGGEIGRREPSKLNRQPSAAHATQIEMAMRDWLLAQVACSEAREAEEHVVDDSFLEYQEQTNLVREVNSMRENISTLKEKILEKKLAICGDTPLAALLIKDAEASKDTMFFKCMSNGRHVTEMLLRSSVLVVFGAKMEEQLEDDENALFLSLTPEEVMQLRDAARAANEVHDLEEIEALYALSVREEEEMQELKTRMEELRHKENFTEDDEEEMRQLDAALTDVVRRHETTQWRIRHLRALGRDKRFLKVRDVQDDMVYSELNLAFSGDKWGVLLANTEYLMMVETALCNDLSHALGLPPGNMSNFRFAIKSLLVKLTVKHSRDVTAEQLQALANEAEFLGLRGLYERITFRKSYPLNTPSQRLEYEEVLRMQRIKENFAGAGLPEKLEDFADDSEGETDDENYRRPVVEIATVRYEYGLEARYGYPTLAHVGVPAGFEALFEEGRTQLRAAMYPEEEEEAAEAVEDAAVEDAEEKLDIVEKEPTAEEPLRNTEAEATAVEAEDVHAVHTDHVDAADHFEHAEHADHAEHAEHSEHAEHADHAEHTEHTEHAEHTEHSEHVDSVGSAEGFLEPKETLEAPKDGEKRDPDSQDKETHEL